MRISVYLAPKVSRQTQVLKQLPPHAEMTADTAYSSETHTAKYVELEVCSNALGQNDPTAFTLVKA